MFGDKHSRQSVVKLETVALLRAWGVNQQIIKRHEELADLAGTLIFLASADSDLTRSNDSRPVRPS